MLIKMYADGACRGNPGPMGWAAVMVLDGDVVKEVTGGAGHGTNNTAEFMAVLDGLRALEPEDADRVVIYTDSALVRGLLCLGHRSKLPHLIKLRMDVRKEERRLGFPIEYEKLGIEDETFQLADALARQAVPQATREGLDEI